VKGKADDADSIASFSQDDRSIATVHQQEAVAPISESLPVKRSTRKLQSSQKFDQTAQPSKTTEVAKTGPSACACGDAKEDLTMVACENCSRWFHLPCAGYATRISPFDHTY